MDEEDSSSDSDVQELEGFQGFSDAEINNAAYRNSPPFLQRIGNRSTFFNRIVRSSDRSDSDSSPPVLNRENENYEDIPANHSYLGDNLEAVSGRMIYTENRVVSIPIITGHFGPILPGQTFPLNVQHFERTEMLKSCKERDRTFGVLAISDDKKKVNVYGTTAEIYEYADEARWIAIKAKARQRFKLLNPKKYNLEADIRMAEVLILPEVQLQHPFDAVNSPAFNALRVHGKERQRRYQSSFFPWPKWVYDMYDSEKLVQQANKLTFLKQGLRKERGVENLMPQEPTELSFWIANHLDPDQKLFVLKINSPIPRLRWLLSFISKIQRYVCANCDVFIAKPEDIFAMSAEGAQNTYVNSEGFHHDTITLMKADSVIPISSPSTHFSWFPGYAWSIAVCQCCQKHLGWQFIANKKDLWPKKFWGITRKSLQTRIGGPYDFGEQPVM